MASGVTHLTLTSAEMAAYIDHTLLKPEAAPSAVEKLCEEAIHYGFKAVCVNSSYVARVHERLRNSKVAVCSVVGFPLGAVVSRAKAFEAGVAVSKGADELDMVINLGLLKAGDHKAVEEDIKAVRYEAGAGVALKVIIETCLLTDEEKIKACEIAKNAGADFVKTSTGFSTGGATLADIALMRRTVGPDMGVKASGGIKDWAGAAAMIEAGATRIGTSSGVAIVTAGASSS